MARSQPLKSCQESAGQGADMRRDATGLEDSVHQLRRRQRDIFEPDAQSANDEKGRDRSRPLARRRCCRSTREAAVTSANLLASR